MKKHLILTYTLTFSFTLSSSQSVMTPELLWKLGRVSPEIISEDGKNYILNGLDSTFFYNAIHTIKDITAKDLQLLAQQYLNPEEFYEMVVI